MIVLDALTLDDLGALDLQRHSHEPLLAGVWELRSNLSAYDAVYVALAEAVDGVLVTCDGALARAPGVQRANRAHRATYRTVLFERSLLQFRIDE